MQTLARQFAHRLNDLNSKSLELGDPLFRPLDQLMKYEKEFRVTAVRFKGGTFVSFEDGSRVSWDEIAQMWCTFEHEQLTLPGKAFEELTQVVADVAGVPFSKLTNKAQQVLDLVKCHHGVSDAFIMSQNGKMIDIAAVVDSEANFAMLTENFDFQKMPDDTSVFVRRLVSTANYFVCSSPARTK